MLFSKQLDSNRPIATCGLFVIDWTLLFTVSIVNEMRKEFSNRPICLISDYLCDYIIYSRVNSVPGKSLNYMTFFHAMNIIQYKNIPCMC